jgi:probable HAF family extracellular repeat protein
VNVRHTRFRPGLVAALVVLGAVGCVRPDPPPPDRRIAARTLQPLPGHRYAQANDINEKGEAVGWSIGAAGAQKAVLWRDNRAVDLRPLPASGSLGSFGWKINERSQALVSEVSSLGVVLYLWDAGRVTDLSGGMPHSTPLDLNDNGEVLTKRVTSGLFGPNPRYRIDVWSNGTFTPLAIDVGTVALTDLDLLNDGSVVGTRGNRPFRWKDGVFTDLAPTGSVIAANERGDVVGWVRTGDAVGAVLWRDGEAIAIDPGDGRSFQPRSLSEDGRVIGHASDPGPTGGNPETMLWQDGRLTSLGPGWYGSLVNDRGIVIGSIPDPTGAGDSHAVVYLDGRVVDLGGKTYVHGMSNRGQFVGTFGNDARPGSSVQGDAVLWTVLP